MVYCLKITPNHDQFCSNSLGWLQAKNDSGNLKNISPRASNSRFHEIPTFALYRPPLLQHPPLVVPLRRVEPGQHLGQPRAGAEHLLLDGEHGRRHDLQHGAGSGLNQTCRRCCNVQTMASSYCLLNNFPTRHNLFPLIKYSW